MMTFLIVGTFLELLANAEFITFLGGGLTALGGVAAKYFLFKGKKVNAEVEKAKTAAAAEMQYREKEWENLREIRELMDKRFGELDYENKQLRARVQDLEVKIETLQDELIQWQARATELEREKAAMARLVPDHCKVCPLRNL